MAGGELLDQLPSVTARPAVWAEAVSTWLGGDRAATLTRQTTAIRNDRACSRGGLCLARVDAWGILG